jgi:hypothetical protein
LPQAKLFTSPSSVVQAIAGIFFNVCLITGLDTPDELADPACFVAFSEGRAVAVDGDSCMPCREVEVVEAGDEVADDVVDDGYGKAVVKS